MDKKDWHKLGFNKSQISIIFNYKKKLGSFKNKSQLFSCFAFNGEDTIRLEKIVAFPEPKSSNDLKYGEFLKVVKSKLPNYKLAKVFDSIYYAKKDDEYHYYLKFNNENTSLFKKASGIMREPISKTIKFFIKNSR